MELLIIHLLNVVIFWAMLGLSLNILQGTSSLCPLGNAALFAPVPMGRPCSPREVCPGSSA